MLLGQRCTERADIYSFGVVLWEVCTGAVPTRGRMRALEVPVDCPAEVAALVTDCMAADPMQRPSAQQLVERLLLAPASPPSGHGPSSLPRQSAVRQRPPLPRSLTMAAAAPANGEMQQAQLEPQASQTRAAPLAHYISGSLPLPKRPALQPFSSGAAVAGAGRASSSPPESHQADIDKYGLGI